MSNSVHRRTVAAAGLAAALALAALLGGGPRPAVAARSPEIGDLEQVMKAAIDEVAPSVVQVIVPERTKEQIREAQRRDRERRLRELDEQAPARRPVPADEAAPEDADRPGETPADPPPADALPPEPSSPEAPADAQSADEKPADEPPADDARQAEKEAEEAARKMLEEQAEKEGDEAAKKELEAAPDSADEAQLTVRTGLVISADGHVVTSLVNVGRQTEGIRVRLADGRELPAARLGEDTRRDLVLLKVEASGLPVPRFAEKAHLAVGQWVMALGRVLPIDEPTVAKGIVSATGRMAGVAVQTDANISPMNYGGPLVDVEGRVVAVIASIGREGSTAQAGQFSDSGIGFAIPAADILAELDELAAGKRIEVPFLGVQFNMLRIGGGAKIQFVFSTTAAREAGLEAGDVITRVDGKEITSPFQLMHEVGSHKVGDTLALEVQRDGRTMTLQATLKARPEHLPRR